MLIERNCQTRANQQRFIDNQHIKEWRDSHFGMFIHFGVYSELGGIWKGEKIPYYGEQIMNHARITIPEYEEVAKNSIRNNSMQTPSFNLPNATA